MSVSQRADAKPPPRSLIQANHDLCKHSKPRGTKITQWKKISTQSSDEKSPLNIALANLHHSLGWLFDFPEYRKQFREQNRPPPPAPEPPEPKFEEAAFTEHDLDQVATYDNRLQAIKSGGSFTPNQYELRENWDFREPEPRLFDKDELSEVIVNFANYQKRRLERLNAKAAEPTRLAANDTLPKGALVLSFASQGSGRISPRQGLSEQKNTNLEKLKRSLDTAESRTFRQFDIGLDLQVGMGFTANHASNNAILTFINQPDRLKHRQEENKPLLAASLLARFPVASIPGILHDDFGLKLAYSNYRIKGDVLEFGMAQFNNFDYHLRSKNITLLLENRIIARRVFKEAHPWVGFELGGNYVKTRYDEHIKPGLAAFQRDTDIGNSGHVDFVAAALAGFMVPFTRNSEIEFHYEYMFYGHQKTGSSGNHTNYVKGPSYEMLTNQFLLGWHYHFFG